LSWIFGAGLSALDERPRRRLAGAQARALGGGGIAWVARAARIRRPGAGRKRSITKDPKLLAELDALAEPTSRGDPMCPLRWISQSIGNLAEALPAARHLVSPDTVGRLLRDRDYSLQANAQQLEGFQHEDRHARFVYLLAQVAEHLREGHPVISVDAKNKEVVGQRGSRP